MNYPFIALWFQPEEMAYSRVQGKGYLRNCGQAKRIKAAGLGTRGPATGTEEEQEERAPTGAVSREGGEEPLTSLTLPTQPGPGKAPREQVDSVNWTVASTSAESGHNRFHQIQLRMVTPQHQRVYDEGHPRSKSQRHGGAPLLSRTCHGHFRSPRSRTQ